MGWWTRTWHNKGSGDLLLNKPDGWVVDTPSLHWLGPDNLSALLAMSGNKPFGSPAQAAATLESEGGGLPAVTRATSLIVDTLSGIPWDLQRGTETLPAPRWIVDPQLARPDGRLTDWSAEGVSPLSNVAFWAEVLISALWYGDAFVWVPARDQSGQPLPPLFILHPLLVDVVMAGYTDADRPRPGYWVKTSETEWERLSASEVIHVRGMGPYWSGRGRGAITGHLGAWGDAAAQRSYSTGIFTAGVPAGYLRVTSPNLTADQAEALKAKWLEQHGDGPRSIAVLNATTEFVPIQLPPESAQLAEAKRMSTLDVANAFGVEPFMLGLPSDGSTYANIESRMTAFSKFTLLPWARRVEGALDSEFPLGTGVHLNLEGLTRADSATRVTYYTAGLAQGWLTTAEVRHAEGLPPMVTPAPTPTPEGASNV